MRNSSENKRSKSLFLMASLLISSFVAVYGSQDSLQKISNLDCSECHTCDKPTLEEPCLHPCPRLFTAQVNAGHSTLEAPDKLVLDAITNEYGPVNFDHELHAEMAAMDQGCSQCHHYSPVGKIPPCGDCHGGEANPANLRQPSLKGAYHRQCLGCHREWSHSTACDICHIPVERIDSKKVEDSTDILGISHPVIKEPVRKIYRTPYKSAPIVTFYHKEHIDLFNLRCVDCHKQENCSNCHDIQNDVRHQKTDEEIHALCSDCHGTKNCGKCHDKVERPGFTHANTGWVLGPYHDDLGCNSCHAAGERISSLDNSCSSCHETWNQDNFSHVVTGVKLDETHSTIDCEECHPGNAYRSDPDCSECHEDGWNHRSNPLGM